MLRYFCFIAFLIPALSFAQLTFSEHNIDLGAIPEASEIKGDVVVRNISTKKVFLMRADAERGVKVYTSRKTLQPNDTCLLVISFTPESGGRFKKDIRLVSSDQSTPYELSLAGNIARLKQDDKTACYYFGSRRSSNIPVKETPIVVNEERPKRDNSNRMPDRSQAETPPAPSKKEMAPQPETPASKELSLLGYRPNNILFLVDVSGSMKDSLKLPLMKQALHTLIEAVRDVDYITFVTYSDTVRVLAEGVTGADKTQLHAVTESLKAHGLTRGNKAILFSQQLAQQHYIAEGNNQILLATDGQFKFHEKDYVTWTARQASGKIILSTVAFGDDKIALKNLEDIAKKGEGSFIRIKKRNGNNEQLLEEIKLRSRR